MALYRVLHGSISHGGADGKTYTVSVEGETVSTLTDKDVDIFLAHKAIEAIAQAKPAQEPAREPQREQVKR